MLTCKSFHYLRASVVAALVVASGWLVAGEPPTPAPAPVPSASAVPDWALGVFSLRQLQGVREKAAGYANKIIPNSGELGTNVALNFLFSIPLNTGLKPDGPALIYFLTPLNPAQPVERAMILTVSDAAALKTALAGSLGMPTDDNGVLTYSIPQPLPNPDKLLVMKIVRSNLLVAPNAATLRSLEDFLGARDSASLVADSDVNVTLKIANIKRVYGGILTSSLESGAIVAGQTVEQGEMLKSQVHNVLESIYQADTIQARLTFNADKTSAGLEFRLTGLPGTALATTLTGDAPTVSGKLNTLLPFDPALLLTWNINAADSAGLVRNLIKFSALKPDAGDDTQQARFKVADAFAGLLDTTRGDTMVSVGARTGQAITPVVVVSTADSKKTLDSLVAFYQRLIDALNTESRVKNGNEFLTEERAPEETIAGAKVIGRRLAIIGTTDNFMDDIFFMKMADLKNAIAVATGTGSHDAFKAMVENSAKPATVPADVQALFAALPRGTAAVMLLRPIALIRLAAAKANPQGPAEKLTAGLANPVAAVSVRVAEATASVKLELPAAIPDAIYQLVQRLQRAGMKFDDLFKPAPDSAPAPPAP